jgi:MYXO-CTERM domain-containing protein
LTTEDGSAILRFLLLILTTTRRLALLLFVFLAWTPAAYAWSWPVQGPVLQPFSYDEAHPYASGQHRGIDIGVGSAGESVVAPAAGTVSFAGSVPTNGKSVTIETADGYSVTLTHLGSIGVVKGAAVAEQDAIGTVGPSGTPEVDGPYVHLGIRVTADPNGYVDPLGLLPPDTESSATESDSSVSQPSSSSAAPASKPAPAAPAAPRKRRAATSRASRPAARSHVSTHPQERVQEPRSRARTSRSSHRPAVRDRASEQTGSSRRPVVEPVAPRPIGLDAGHELRPPVSLTQPRRKQSSPLPELVCNGTAAVFALALVLAASRRRRRPRASSTTGAEVLQLPQPAVVHPRVSRAA